MGDPLIYPLIFDPLIFIAVVVWVGYLLYLESMDAKKLVPEER
jgi:hypothetical protein